MEIAKLGEFGLIDRLTKDIEIKNESTLKGVGDDCAVLSYPDKEVLVTTDLLMEGYRRKGSCIHQMERRRTCMFICKVHDT